MYFCKGYDHGEKVDLSKGYWNPKGKMWVTTRCHCSMTDTVAVNVVVALKKRICLNIDQVVILQGEMRCLSLLGLL